MHNVNVSIKNLLQAESGLCGAVLACCELIFNLFPLSQADISLNACILDAFGKALCNLHSCCSSKRQLYTPKNESKHDGAAIFPDDSKLQKADCLFDS